MHFLTKAAIVSVFSIFATPGYAEQACSNALQWQIQDSKHSEVAEILEDLPITTKWADLDSSTKVRLKTLAEERLSEYRAQWSENALANKLKILLECPTQDMSEAIDDFYKKYYDSVASKDFEVKNLKHQPLKAMLVRHYLGMIATHRASLSYTDKKLPNRDWDGKSLFDSTRLPDEVAYKTIGLFNANIVADLRRLDKALLSDVGRKLAELALFDARANASVVFDGTRYNNTPYTTACDAVVGYWNVVSGYTVDKKLPVIFDNYGSALHEVNAIYLSDLQMKWLNIGSLPTAINYCDPGTDFIKEKVEKAEKAEKDGEAEKVSKGIILLRNWWIERVSATSQANRKCSIYSDADRSMIWEDFSSGLMFNNDGSYSMQTFVSLLHSYTDEKRADYKAAAISALNLVFPNDSVLTPEERRQVIKFVNSETEFGRFVKRIETALDAAQNQSNGPAARIWRKTVAKTVKQIGGNYKDKKVVRPKEEEEIREMFEEVKEWVANKYNEYPINIQSIYKRIPLIVTTKHNAFADREGPIEIGLGTSRSKMEHYSTLIHELRHGVYFALKSNSPDKSKVATDDGFALEGSAMAAESMLLRPFLRQILGDDDLAYALYVLEYGIRDARVSGTTDATLQKFYRASCEAESELDTIEFTKEIAVTHGLTGKHAENLAIRAHQGAAYFQYIWGELQMREDLKYLQAQIDPSGERRLDPFVLFACGLNTPRRSEAYVNKLRACVLN